MNKFVPKKEYMTKKPKTYQPISTEICNVTLRGKYKHIRYDEYKLIMEDPFHYEITLKGDILECSEIVDWIMKQELVELYDDWCDVYNNAEEVRKLIEEYEKTNKESFSKDKWKELLEKNITRTGTHRIHSFWGKYSPEDVKYLLSISLGLGS